MRTNFIIVSAVVATAWVHLVVADQAKHSQYSGQEQRAINSLSQEDITELARGGGWGMAKVAELNGLPGFVATNPCANVPKGHDSAMWRKHNGCK